ncbi:7031_t:CDS:2, partial [Scutellospora calospora]
TIGYTLYLHVYKDKEYKNLLDANNSPIQLISQIKGYFYVNPYIAISLAITLFSFVGVPPLIGFFAKQMVLSAALDNGYVFMTLVAILTSVIGAGYYLSLIKQIFFFKDDYKINPSVKNLSLVAYINPASFSSNKDTSNGVKVEFNPSNITINSALTIILLAVNLIFAPHNPYEEKDSAFECGFHSFLGQNRSEFNSESATASGLTYFLLGGLSSCFILLGSALLYVNSGTTNLDNIYVISSISEIEDLT